MVPGDEGCREGLSLLLTRWRGGDQEALKALPCQPLENPNRPRPLVEWVSRSRSSTQKVLLEPVCPTFRSSPCRPATRHAARTTQLHLEATTKRAQGCCDASRQFIEFSERPGVFR